MTVPTERAVCGEVVRGWVRREYGIDSATTTEQSQRNVGLAI